MRTLLDEHKFPIWCRLCADRCNSLDLAGYVKSKWALDKFIEDAASAYADKQLQKLGNLKDGESFKLNS